MAWEYILYTLLALAGVVAVLALAPLLFGRMILPGLTMSLFSRFGGLFKRRFDSIKPGLDLKIIVRAGNRYYRRAFAATPFDQRILFVPFCLRPRDCPAPVDPEMGMLCTGGCPGCELGELRGEALALGYQQVYVVPSSRMLKDPAIRPSSQFIKDKLKEHSPQAALGVVCAWHLRKRLIPKFNVGRKGFAAGDGVSSVLQGVLLTGRNCKSATVDWNRLRRLLHLCESPLDQASKKAIPRAA